MRYFYAIHKKYGCIKKISDTAIGHMNQHEWVVYEKFPDEVKYFNVLGQEIMIGTHNEQSREETST